MLTHPRPRPSTQATNSHVLWARKGTRTRVRTPPRRTDFAAARRQAPGHRAGASTHHQRGARSRSQVELRSGGLRQELPAWRTSQRVGELLAADPVIQETPHVSITPHVGPGVQRLPGNADHGDERFRRSGPGAIHSNDAPLRPRDLSARGCGRTATAPRSTPTYVGRSTRGQKTTSRIPSTPLRTRSESMPAALAAAMPVSRRSPTTRTSAVDTPRRRSASW